MKAIVCTKYGQPEVLKLMDVEKFRSGEIYWATKVIDYTKEDFSKPYEYDVIFDTLGKSPISHCLKSLKKKGIYLHAVVTTALGIRLHLISIITGKLLVGGTFTPETRNLIYLKDLVEKGELKPVIDRRYSLDKIVETHRYVDTGHKRVDVIISV